MLKQCPRCGNEEIESANYCMICGLKFKEAPEVPTQEQLKITIDYGVLESSRFFITTDKTFYEKMIKSSNTVSVFTPELLNEPNTKEIPYNVSDLSFYVFRIPEDKSFN